jgi:hypothetical protein
MIYIPKPNFKHNNVETLELDDQFCEWSGCQMGGKYRAPKSKKKLREYRWFCIEHVRIYNKSWNYYEGMSDKQLEKAIRSDITWNRPTWPIGNGYNLGFGPKRNDISVESLGDPFGFFTKKKIIKKHTSWKMEIVFTVQERKALSLLDLDNTVTATKLRGRYKSLVKQCHPDVTYGDKKLEERFKQIKQAYDIIMAKISKN